MFLGSILGISFGLGFPCGAALFADLTEIGNRGRLAGVLVLTTFLLISFEIFIAQFFSFGIVGVVILTMLLRSTSYLALVLDPCDKKRVEKRDSLMGIFSRRDFALYLFPWVMFNLVSGIANFIYLGIPQTPEYVLALQIGELLQFLGLASVSLISGYISDRFGRKPPIVIGVLMFGVSFAIFGLATSPLSLMVQLLTHGIAWGFCMVTYFAIPGDLAGFHHKEKFYAIFTVLPFTSYMATGTISLILGVSAEASILSPILSTLMFLSVVPVLFIQDPLEAYLKAKRMREHADKLADLVVKSKKTDDHN